MKQKIVLIVGPTAVGKTALSLKLARHFSGQIISGDSMQVYRGLDIGTAKATPAEQAQVQHYLIDCQEIDQRWSVADFIQATEELTAQISQAGDLPLLVGGTGFYLQALLDGYQLGGDKFDQTDLAYREKWQAFAEEKGSQALWDKLDEIDPQAAAKIPVRNRSRIIRALEVYEKTGQRFSDQADQPNPHFEAFIIGLNTDRALLYERINQRVDQMFAAGLLEEARRLYEAGGLALPAGKGIGYKELYPYFEGHISLEEAKADIKQNSRHYAKRQLTWFRNKMQVNWYDLVLHPEDENKIIKDLTAWLNPKEG